MDFGNHEWQNVIIQVITSEKQGNILVSLHKKKLKTDKRKQN